MKPNIYCSPLARLKTSARPTVSTEISLFCVYAKLIKGAVVPVIKNHIADKSPRKHLIFVENVFCAWIA